MTAMMMARMMRRSEMRIIAVLLAVTFLPVAARADDALAKKFLYHVPGQLRDFDPVEDALKQDGLKGKELKREAERIKIGLGHRGQRAHFRSH
jgi:hypothetical protein